MGHRPGRLPWTQNSNRRRMRTCQVLSVKQSCDLSQTEVAIPLSRPLSSGQLVELILDENPSSSERCRVVWVGKAGSAPSWKELASQCQGRWLVSWTQCPTEPVAHGGEPYLRHHLLPFTSSRLRCPSGFLFRPLMRLRPGDSDTCWSR